MADDDGGEGAGSRQGGALGIITTFVAAWTYLSIRETKVLFRDPLVLRAPTDERSFLSRDEIRHSRSYSIVSKNTRRRITAQVGLNAVGAARPGHTLLVP